MLQINIQDVSPLDGDALRQMASGSLPWVAQTILAASKTESDIGETARTVAADLLSVRHQVAFEAIMELLPVDVRELLDGENWPSQIQLMTDGDGTFAAVIMGHQALVGTGEELVRMLSNATQRAARKVAGSVEASADARYQAAAIARSFGLKVVG